MVKSSDKRQNIEQDEKRNDGMVGMAGWYGIINIFILNPVPTSYIHIYIHTHESNKLRNSTVRKVYGKLHM